MKRKKKWNKENRLKLKDIKCSEKSKQDKHKITSQYISGKLLKYLSKQKKNPKCQNSAMGWEWETGKRDILTNTRNKLNGDF